MKIKIKKIIVILILLIVFIRVSSIFFRNHFLNKYELKYNEYKIYVEEQYKESQKDKISSYFITVNVDNIEYKIQLLNKYNKEEKIIEKIYYYNGKDYKCLYPVFKYNKQYTDVICTKEEKYLYYHNIEEPSENLKEFVDNIKEYNINNYNNNEEKVIIDNTYINTNYKEHAYLTNYKGYYDLKNKENIQLFQSDIYEQSLSTFLNNYYIIPDYNQTYEFDKIFVINMINNKKQEIVLYPKISFDSYIQGIVEDNIYLYDKKNKKQYKINPKALTIELVGNTQKGIKIYKDSQWEIESSSNCSNNNIMFDNKYMSDITDSTYERIDKVGINIGNYYFYKKENDYYKVYKSTLEDKNSKIYLFTTKTINRIKYYNNNIYYVDYESLKVYNDEFGEKVIATFNELKFNNTINFGVYKK